MTDLELNKDLHEKVMGKCWHNEKDRYNTSSREGESNYVPMCSNCGKIAPTNPFYTRNPADYWELLQKIKEHKEWGAFLENTGFVDVNRNLSVKASYRILLDMPRGCQAIWEFFVKSTATKGKEE